MNRKPNPRLPIVLLALILIPILAILFVLAVEGRPSLRNPLPALDLTSPFIFALLVLAVVPCIAAARALVLLPLRGDSRQCPRCGGELHRVHRIPADKLLSRIVHVHRYRCTNPRCGWQGLRRRHHSALRVAATHPPAAT